jgi:hypothetical protein
MPDRTINFGDDAADARYRIQDTSSTGGDLVLAEDLDGGTVLLEYDYSASEWVSRGPVNLNGNDITNAGSVSADTLEADSLTIGAGQLYEEDINSPINISSESSFTYNVGNTYDEIIIIPDPIETSLFDQLQVNGDTESNYRIVDNSDTRTTGLSQFTIPTPQSVTHYNIAGRQGSRIALATTLAADAPGQTIAGRNLNISPPIDQFTFSDSGSGNAAMRARVYGRSIEI